MCSEIENLFENMSGSGLNQFSIRTESVEIRLFKVIDSVDVFFQIETSSQILNDDLLKSGAEPSLKETCAILCECLNKTAEKAVLLDDSTIKLSFADGHNIYIGGRKGVEDFEESISIIADNWPVKGQQARFYFD